MATQLSNLPYDTSTAANYKAIFMAIGTALASFGWVRLTDTGTVSWAGISTLPGNGTYRDWEIFRMDDTAQATMPVYMKLEYSTQGTNAPLLRTSIGTGSNGSGTLTGTIMMSNLLWCGSVTTSPGAGNTYASFFSGANNRFTFLMWQGAGGNYPIGFAIERSHDSSGADTDEYVIAQVVGQMQGSPATTYSMMKNGQTSSQQYLRALSSPGTANFAGSTAVCPTFPWVGRLGNPNLGIIVTPFADVGEGAIVTAYLYGVTHTYVGCKASGPNGTFGLSISPAGGLQVCTLLRYE